MPGVQTYISLFFMHLPLFLGNGKHQKQDLKRNYEEASTNQTMAKAKPPPPPPQVEPNARRTRVLRGLTHEQLSLVDMYKSENLIGGKYFDTSVLREFGFEDMVNRLQDNRNGAKYSNGEDRHILWLPMSFLLEMCPTKTLDSLCVEFRLTFPYFSCTYRFS